MTPRSDLHISAEQVRETARLAKLSFTDEEIEAMREDLGSVLTYVSVLDEMDTTDVDPLHMLHGHTVEPRGGDAQSQMLSQDEALRNTPDTCGAHVRVPRVL